MSGYIEKGVIRLHEKVGTDIWRMQAELPLTAKEAKPGQFVHVSVNDSCKLLRRPISIAGTDPMKGLVEIIYRVVGEGTERLSYMKVGDKIDSLGPLGTSFSVNATHIVGVGGGVGIASGLAMEAVPTCTVQAPAIINSATSFPVMIPPRPQTGT